MFWILGSSKLTKKSQLLTSIDSEVYSDLGTPQLSPFKPQILYFLLDVRAPDPDHMGDIGHSM